MVDGICLDLKAESIPAIQISSATVENKTSINKGNARL